MTDFDRGSFADEDRLPWLEAVDDEEGGRGPGAGKLIAAVVAALLVIGLIIGGVFWLRERGAESGDGSLIAAPEGDYKIPPDGPGANGMAVEGEGDASFAASEGVETNSAINLNAQPEVPMAGGLAPPDAGAVQTRPLPPSTAAQVPGAPPVAAPPVKKAEPPKPAPAPVNKGPTIQLGAFNSTGIANTEWSRLSRQFPMLNTLDRSVTTVLSGGKTLYRLRASGAGAVAACDKVRAAGKPCNVIAK